MEQLVNLKQFRQKHKITQTAAAEAIGIDQRQWNRYENGKNEIPVRYIKAICEAFNISADDLIGNEKNNDTHKLAKLIEETKELLSWAEYQEHISEEATDILLENLERIIADL